MNRTPPALIILGIALLLFASKFYFFNFYVGTATQQVMMVAVAWAQGYALGWFVSPRGKSFRRYLMIAGSILLVLVAIGDSGKLGWSLTTFIAFVCFLIAFFSWFKGRLGGFFDKPTTFGSAEWATTDYLIEHKVVGDTGLRLGKVPGPDGTRLPVHYDGDRHALLTAPTRSNNGTSAIIPNLLTYTGSALVIDPKGENAMITRDARAAMDQDIHVVDP